MILDLLYKVGGAVVADPQARLRELIASGQREVVLSGSAGTGKTTLVRSLTSDARGQVELFAPTGRAARRLTEVTGISARTIHSGLYGQPQEDKYGELIWPPPKPLGDKGTLLVMDESSMIDNVLATHIRQSAHPEAQILWVGDPYQLPPIDEVPGVNLHAPDIHLSKVWRSGDGIMDLAYLVLRCETYHELRAVMNRAMRGEFPGVQQVPGWEPQRWRAECLKQQVDATLITYTNPTRRLLNMTTRIELGYPNDQLMDGEVLSVVANHQHLGLCNGDSVEVVNVIDEEDPDMPLHLHYVKLRDRVTGRQVKCYLDARGFNQDTRDFKEARREDSMSWGYKLHFKNPRWAEEAVRRERGEIRGRLAGPAGYTPQVTFGYANTAHREQGSGHDVVGIVWDNWKVAMDQLEFAKSWLYTSLTRARYAVVLWC